MAGMPHNDVALDTAFITALAVVSAANAPMMFASILFSKPVDKAKIVSPSNIVCVGIIVRANPLCAI